ncbi:semaphorin-4E-like [Seriola dumerili]|uniref:semaphorin-4E-like n=1 Tax=Seriola dumerili TaxID=41447 RepID=UPI000BBE0CCC|nr:semaphorin-4E-like [Seriola dumerili]
MNVKQFEESGFGGLSSLMIRDDIRQLVVGARGKVLTLSLDDITKKTSEAKWSVSSADKALCRMKGKDMKIFKNGKLSLEGKKQVGKGKVPFDPYERFASLMNGNTLYSAVSSNFLGTEVLFQRHGLNLLKTEMKRSWFNEPTMISISLVETSRNSDNGEDDNVFLFFTESAVEERHDNIRVSRIARVCKSDLGGERTLQKRWTSFLKARLDCQFGDGGLPTLVQDVFLLRDLNNESIFYATLTSGSESSGGCSKSAVCAYKLSDITQVFSGRFLTERESGRWDTYTGEEPFPHPGSCINDEMRANGVTTSLDLSDKTLLFVKNHPLMEGVVAPMTGKPLLVQTGTRFSKIIVDQVTSLDGRQHQVMLIGTDSGWLQKAVRFDGEDVRVIEELQLFRAPQPIDFLQLASKTGQLYSGTSNIAVQVDVRDCSRYTSCNDCLLSRDPYCGWDKIRGQCGSVVGASTGSITNLPISWRFSDNILPPGPRHTVLRQGLIIRPSYSDAGFYTCETVETVKGKVHRETVVRYLVRVQDTNTLVRSLKAAAITLALLVVSLILIMCRRIICLKAKKQNNIDCGNENSNNNQETTVRPPFHHDQTEDRCTDEGRVQCGHGSDDVT